VTSNDPEQPYRYDPYTGQPYPYDPYAGQPHSYDPLSGQPYPQPQPYGGAYPPPMPAPAAYGYAPVGQNDGLRNQAIGVLVTNIATTVLCCSPLGIAGIVVGALAMGRVDTQPDSARSLVKWGWGLAIVSVVLVVIMVVAFIVIVMLSESATS